MVVSNSFGRLLLGLIIFAPAENILAKEYLNGYVTVPCTQWCGRGCFPNRFRLSHFCFHFQNYSKSNLCLDVFCNDKVTLIQWNMPDRLFVTFFKYLDKTQPMWLSKRQINFSRSFYVSRTVHKRADLFGFSSWKKDGSKSCRLTFLVALPLPQKSAASASPLLLVDYPV